MLIPTRHRLTRQRMLSLLKELEADNSPATSLYVPRDLTILDVEKALQAPLGQGLEEVMPDITDAIARSTTGAVIFWGEQAKYLVMPPFPINETLFASGYNVEPLRSMLQHDLLLGLILVRLGALAVGVFQGGKLLSRQGGTGT